MLKNNMKTLKINQLENSNQICELKSIIRIMIYIYIF